MAAPENGPPNRALKMHTSKVPARSGTSPMAAMMMPAGPPITSRPPAMSAMPPTIRTTRPAPEAMNWPSRLAANQLGFCCVWVVMLLLPSSLCRMLLMVPPCCPE